MDYKEKYEQALEVAQRFYNNSVAITKKGLEDIFPELKESEDERMANIIREALANVTSENTLGKYGLSHSDVSDWLEKQGKQKSIDDLTQQEAMDIAVAKCFEQGEQKPAENEELTEFDKAVGVSIGTWNPKTPEQIQSVKAVSKKLLKLAKKQINDEQKVAWSEDDEMFVHGLIRGLTAKRDIHGHTTFSSDCIDITETINWLKSIKDRVQPKQEWSDVDKNILSRIIDNLMFIRDTISIDPNYAVNISDTEREITWLKSLKNKVQPKQEWSEEDDAVLDALIRHLEGEDIHVSPHLAVKCLKSLKNRVQPKQEWSEEDEDIKETIIGELELVKKSVGEINYNGYDKLIDWLKSLRPQNRWKPSDEQMDALRYVTNFDYGGYKAALVLLYEQLKKLKE